MAKIYCSMKQCKCEIFCDIETYNTENILTLTLSIIHKNNYPSRMLQSSQQITFVSQPLPIFMPQNPRIV